MEAPSTPSGSRTLTPAVLLAVVFTMACAFVSIAFVAARGGLDLPLAATTPPGVARASTVPTNATASTPGPTAAPQVTAMPLPSGPGSPEPSLSPTAPPTPYATPDPLAVLPPCPDHPGCYLYTIRRGDTLSTIADRWLISIGTLEALNPQIGDPSTIVVGQVLYLGRTPFLRLATCNDFSGCYLYVVRPGDRLSTIAGRFGISTAQVLAVNPRITDPNAIYSGQTIRLPGPT